MKPVSDTGCPPSEKRSRIRLRVFGTMHRLPLVEIESGPDSAKDALVSTKQVFVNRAWRDAGIYDRVEVAGRRHRYGTGTCAGTEPCHRSDAGRCGHRR